MAHKKNTKQKQCQLDIAQLYVVSNSDIYEMKWMVLYAMILHCKAALGRGQPGLMR